VRPIAHGLHAAGKWKIRRRLEEPVIILTSAPVYAAEIVHDGSPGTLAMARGGIVDTRPLA
jgi:hypothetical protein